MSLRQLPSISALSAPIGARWDIPSSAAERWRPSAAQDNTATLTIYESIGEQWDGTGMTAKRVAGILRANEGKDITVSINSPGGDFFEGIAIYNLLREHKAHVTVQVVGLAASAASVIAMAGDKVCIAKSAFIMIHNAWSVVMGNRHDLAEAVKVLEPFDEAMASVYSARTGLPAADVAEMMNKDTWLGGDAAVAQGFADELMQADLQEDDTLDKRKAALRAADIALAKQGVPRSQRRDMLKELNGTPGAAVDDATPRAGLEVLQSLANVFKEK